MTPTYLAAAVEGAEDAFVTKNLDGIIQSWNDAATRLFGYSEAEVVGQSIYILIPMDRMNEEREILRRIRNGQRVEQYETVRMTKDGKRIAVSVAISPIKNAQGEVIGASKIARRVSATVLPGSQLASTILDLLPLAVYVCDASGSIIAYNRKATELWGRAPVCGDEYFCGSHRLFHSDGTPMQHDECPMAQAILTGQEQGRGEIIIERPDGKRLFALAEPVIIRNADGEVMQALNVLQDITAHKRDEALRAHLAAIVAGSNDGIVSKNLQGIIQTWNPAAESIFGYTPDEAIGRPITMLFPPDRLHEEAEIMQRISSGERIDQFETERVCKDGRRINVSLTISPVTNDEGRIVGASKIVRDITDFKADKRTKAHLAAIVESSNDAIISMDLDGNIQSWNRSAERLFGYEPCDVVGRSISILIPDDRRDDERHILERVRRGERVSHYETVRVTKEGRRVELSLTVSPIWDRNDRVIGASKTARDIGEQKQAERAIARLNRDLRQRIDELQTLFNVAPIGIAIAEDRECERIFVNEAGARLLGVSPTQNISMAGPDRHALPFRVLSNGRHLTSDELPMRQAAQLNKDVRGMEIDFVHDNGKIVHSLMYASPLHDEDGAVRGSLGIVIDISERRRTERELLKSQHMESIGVLAGGIAHDFNNILTALFGNISLARLAVIDNDAALASLSQAENAFMRARDLTQQLLTFSRGGAPIRKTASIGDFLKEAVTFLLHGSAIRAVFDVASDLWPAEVDLGQLNQAINNLVINAKEAMPTTGTLRITARNVELDDNTTLVLRPGRYIEIAFSDTGSGIPEEYLGSIFDPYFTTKRTGTGLGLATTYSIVKRHDGDIAVRSEIGKGATFSIYLPASANALAAQEPATAITASGGGRVLVMDDEPQVRSISQALLKRLGYEPALADSGEEAIDLYRAALDRGERFDLVILDLTVPGGMGGLECLRRLHEIDPTVCALVSSGYSNDPIMSRYADYGFRGVLSKPYRLTDLGDALAVVRKKAQS